MSYPGQGNNVIVSSAFPHGLRYAGETRSNPDDQASRLRSMVDAMHAGGAAALRSEQPPAILPAPQRHCPVVAITSGKGGVGKTSICVNLAVALSQGGARTTLLDADLGLANADVLCGLTPTTRLDAVVDGGRSSLLHTQTAQRRQLSQIAIEAPGGFRLVPGAVGIARMANLPASQRDVILRGLSDLEAQSDVVMVDTGAGLSDGVTTFAAAADLTLIVATPEPTSIADAYAMLKCITQLRSQRAPGAGFRTAFVINQAASPSEGRAVHARIAATAKRFLGISPPLLGVLLDDAALPASVRARTPLLLNDPSSKISKDLRALARELATLLSVSHAAQAIPARRGLFGWLRGKIT